MSESLADILNRKRSAEPPEIRVIKDFVQTRFKTAVQVSVGPRQITVLAPNSALAGALRMHIFELQNLLPEGRKLVIRIR